MKLSVTDINGAPSGELDIQFKLVEDGRGSQAVHDAVVAYQANQRMGTACTKTMGDVNGTGKKPWRQKGTGRARAGSFASPLWCGGGVVFGPKPRDFGKKINNSTRKLALRKALSERLKAGDVIIVDQFNIGSAKTKSVVAFLKKLAVTGTAILVDAEVSKDLLLAARNVPTLELTTGDSLNTYQVLRPAKLLITRAAFSKLEARLKD